MYNSALFGYIAGVVTVIILLLPFISTLDSEVTKLANQHKMVEENAQLCVDELKKVKGQVGIKTSLVKLVEISRLENTKCEQKKADCEQKREECTRQRDLQNQLLNERFRKEMVDKQPRKDQDIQL